MSQNKSIHELLLYGKNLFKEKNIDTAIIDAEVLLMHVLNFSKVQLFSKNEMIVEDIQQKKYYEFIDQRLKGVPVQYITGVQEFMSLDFYVNQSTLIPRADTETLVESVLELAKKNKLNYIMDMGTGTGCIPISLLYYLNNINAVAVDISADALKTAESNAYRHGVKDRITFVQSNLFSSIPDKFEGRLDAIISNPPYIPTDDIDKLMIEVKDYEPVSALNGGRDGLDFYRTITADARKYICNSGFLIYEIGYNQANDVTFIMKQQSIEDIRIIKDLAGLDRVVIGKIC